MITRILIIIPVYDEAEVLQETISNLQRTSYDLCFVDDGSTDESMQIMQEAGVTVLAHAANRGQGAALSTGMMYAAKNNYEIAVHFDADGQHEINDIPAIVEPLLQNKVDIVLGSRFLNRSGRKSIPRTKQILLKCAVVFERLRSGLQITDAHCGFRALNQDALQKMELTCMGYAHASEILTRIKQHKLRYCEVSVHVSYSEYAMKKASDASRIRSILSELIWKGKNRSENTIPLEIQAETGK